MTTTVRVTAHCATTKEVHVAVPGTTELTILQDGESREFFAYDKRVIEVKEVDKTQ